MEKERTETAARDLIGLRVDFGGFVAEVSEDLSLYVSDTSGLWHVCYSYGCDAWDVLTYWMINWHVKHSMAAMENFIKLIVFPVSLRIADIDETYLEDIVGAQSRLNDRIACRLQGSPEDDAEGERYLEKLKAKIKAKQP